MPSSFKSLLLTGIQQPTRAFINALEVEVSQPPNPDRRVRMNSHYKETLSINFLAARALSGESTFTSQGFGVWTTDTEITPRSGFIDVTEDDAILADKGFPNIKASLTEAGRILIMPPFKRGHKQFRHSTKKNGDEYNCQCSHSC